MSEALVATPPEVVLFVEDELQLWHERRAGYTIFGSYVGRVMLTSRRLLFLSAGSSGAGRRLMAAALGGPVGSLLFGQTATDGLDLRALTAEGSTEVPLDTINDCVAHRRCDCATYVGVQYTRTDGIGELAFMPKNSFLWAGAKEWESKILAARGGLKSGPYR